MRSSGQVERCGKRIPQRCARRSIFGRTILPPLLRPSYPPPKEGKDERHRQEPARATDMEWGYDLVTTPPPPVAERVAFVTEPAGLPF